MGVDMWSVGCIFADLLTLQPLFRFSNERQVLAHVLGLFGVPELGVLEMWKKLPKYEKLIDEELKEFVRVKCTPPLH